jgi:hypothetical protein
MKEGSDIKWRSISEDDSLFDESNALRAIIYIKDDEIFQAYCYDINPWNMTDERVDRYAFV